MSRRQYVCRQWTRGRPHGAGPPPSPVHMRPPKPDHVPLLRVDVINGWPPRLSAMFKCIHTCAVCVCQHSIAHYYYYYYNYYYYYYYSQKRIYPSSSVGIQHGNTQAHRRYKLRGSPTWKLETHIHTRGYTRSVGSSINTIGYTSSVGVQQGNTQSHSDRGSPTWKHTFTQEDIQALWESTINTRGYTSSVGSSIDTIGYTSSVGVQQGNTQSHRIYKRP